jgi:hypothetical protein
MPNEIGKIPYGYIYVSFFPPTKRYPNGSFYIGQHKKIKFDKKYHGSGDIVQNWINRHGKLNINTMLLCWAYSLQELNQLEYYWVSDYYNHIKHPDCMNIKAGGSQNGDAVCEKIKQGWKRNPDARTRQKDIMLANNAKMREDPKYSKIFGASFKRQWETEEYRSRHTCPILCNETQQVFESYAEGARVLLNNIPSKTGRVCIRNAIINGGHTSGYTFQRISRSNYIKLKENTTMAVSKDTVDALRKSNIKKCNKFKTRKFKPVSHHTNETIIKLRENCSHNQKAFCVETKQMFISCAEAGRHLVPDEKNAGPSIARVIHGRLKSYKGFHFKPV